MKRITGVPTRLIYIGIVVFLILGCNLSKGTGAASSAAPGNTKQPDNAAAATTAPTFDANSAAKYMVAAFESLSKAYPYQLTEHTTGGNSFTLDRTVDFAATDRSHSSWTQNGKAYEMITIGGQTWWKTDGQWGESNPTKTNDIYALIAPNLHDITYTGSDTVQNTPCYVFSYQLTISDFGLNGSGKAWIGVADGLPRQLDLEAKVNDISTTSQLVYSYGMSFDIQPPK